MFARRIVQGKPIARKVGKLVPVGVFERSPSICIIYHGTVDLSGLTILQSGFNRKHGILHCEAKPSRGQQWVLQLRYGHGKARVECLMLSSRTQRVRNLQTVCRTSYSKKRAILSRVEGHLSIVATGNWRINSHGGCSGVENVGLLYQRINTITRCEERYHL